MKKTLLIILTIIIGLGLIIGIGFGIKAIIEKNEPKDIIITDVSKPTTIEFNIDGEKYEITLDKDTDYAIQKNSENSFVIHYAIGGTPIAEDHSIRFVKEMPSTVLDEIKSGAHTSFIIPKENGEIAVYTSTEGEYEGLSCVLIVFADKNHFVYFETKEFPEDIKIIAEALSFK